MIPGELTWSVIAIAYAWSGGGAWPLLPGPMYYLVMHHFHPLLWVLFLGVPAVCLMVMSLREWMAHKNGEHWSWRQLHDSAKWRGRFSVALIAGWLAVVKVSVSGMSGANATLVIAAAGVPFMLWFYGENRRVQRESRNKQETSGAMSPS